MDKAAQTLELVDMMTVIQLEIDVLKDLLEKHGVITNLEFDACKRYLSSTGQRKEVLDHIAKLKAGVSHYKSNQQDYLRDLFKVEETYAKWRAAQRGTKLHALAADLIRLGQKLPRSKQTLNMYVNDAIGFKMTPEQILYYSPNCFGTADAIIFRNGLLRIHDLKTGENQPRWSS